ncbi:hypothetical protein T484DRAFT_1905273, partial [Baffinella frigidus]
MGGGRPSEDDAHFRDGFPQRERGHGEGGREPRGGASHPPFPARFDATAFPARWEFPARSDAQPSRDDRGYGGKYEVGGHVKVGHGRDDAKSHGRDDAARADARPRVLSLFEQRDPHREIRPESASSGGSSGGRNHSQIRPSENTSSGSGGR